jgi:uncharacterized protein (DUF952 family)
LRKDWEGARYEPGVGGEPERFPHVYGVLPRQLVEFARGVSAEEVQA